MFERTFLNMKIYYLFFFIGCLVLISCEDDQPIEAPEGVHLEFEGMEFVRSQASNTVDTLLFSLSYIADRNELGIKNWSIDSPYHLFDFFYLDNNQLRTYRTSSLYDLSSAGYDFIELGEYDSLPAFNCKNYIEHDGDTLYVHMNKFHSNFYLRLYELRNNTYKELNWFEETGFCNYGTYDYRFPSLAGEVKGTEQINLSPFTFYIYDQFNGSINFEFSIVALKSVFAGRTFKVTIQIANRNLELSNIVESPPFTIE